MVISRILNKKSIILFTILIIILISIILLKQTSVVNVFSVDDSLDKDGLTEAHIGEFFDIRSSAYLNADVDLLESLYHTEIRNGQLAFENEHTKLIYINAWADKHQATFHKVDSYIATRRIEEIEKDKYSVSLAVSTEYTYAYNDQADIETSFRIGSYHTMEFIKKDGNWLVTKEWYGDPFGAFLQIDDLAKVQDIISSGVKPDLSDLNERRLGAVDYANKHSGVARPPEYSFHYNNEYRNYNGHGGDCTNFASQVLYEGGDMPKNGSWNYNSGGATAAWVGASPFHNYMLYSGRASLIASGDHEAVLEHSYGLRPGDYIAYERKGKVAHISIVTDLDSKGYPLVNSHNTDRYKVPWDIGWTSKNVNIYLVRVHY